MKIHLVGAELSHGGRQMGKQTGTHEKANSCFYQFFKFIYKRGIHIVCHAMNERL
jgi:hypothetical protein